ncbi:hypothetical protein GCM10017767_02910 [Halomonas urumqiensis]|nr:hypothetical protein GCM10017767_02910 [Halomonas urumqiensis]
MSGKPVAYSPRLDGDGARSGHAVNPSLGANFFVPEKDVRFAPSPAPLNS